MQGWMGGWLGVRVVGVTDREERGKEEWMQWTGSIRNEFPEIATHGWAELAWIRKVEAGWGGWEASARPAGQKERDRKTTERGPRAPTGVALHSSWGLTADLDLGIFLSLSLCVYLFLALSLPPPPIQTCFTLRVAQTTSSGMLQYVSYLIWQVSQPQPQFTIQLPGVKN